MTKDSFTKKSGLINPPVTVIKQTKKRHKEVKEKFDFNKLHASIESACMSVRSLEGQADTTGYIICMIIGIWLKDKSEVTSQDLRREAYQALETIHPEAAYIYKNYQKII